MVGSEAEDEVENRLWPAAVNAECLVDNGAHIWDGCMTVFLKTSCSFMYSSIKLWALRYDAKPKHRYLRKDPLQAG